jgi:O-antigen/teichoic acid export membrane protein
MAGCFFIRDLDLRGLWRRLFGSQFLRAGATVFTGAMAVNVLNYVFTLVMGRMLGPADFGAVVTLFGLLMIVTVSSTALTSFMANYSAKFEAMQAFGLLRLFYRKLLGYSTAAGIGVMLVWWALTPAMSGFFKIDAWPIFIFGTVLPLSLFTAAQRGALQGMQRFFDYSLLSILTAIVKLALSVALVWWGFGLSGVMVSLSVGTLLVALYGMATIERRLPPADRAKTAADFPVTRRELFRFVSIAFWASLMLSLFVNLDMMLVKHYFSEAAAGQYSALSTLGKLITYGTTAFITVMYPMVSAAAARGHKGGRLLAMSLAVASLLAAPILLAFAFLPETVIRLMLGPAYLGVAGDLFLFGTAIYLGTLGMAFVNFFLAHHDQLFVWPLVGVILLQTGLLGRFHADIHQVVWVMFWTGLLFVLTMGVRYLALTPRPPQPAASDVPLPRQS